MDKLVRLTKTVNDFGIIINESEMATYVDTEHPYFKSLYYYPNDAKEYFSKKNSIKGYKGEVYTPQITFDIDSQNLEVSRENTLILISHLERLGLYNDSAAKIAFSGSKGFHVHINTEHTFNPTQLKQFCMYLSKQIKFNKVDGFKIDPTVYNTNRIFRVPNTPHEKTGLFKIEMFSQDLLDFSMDKILELAKIPQTVYDYESAIPVGSVREVIEHLPRQRKLSLEAPRRVDVTIDKPCIAKLQEGDMGAGESNSGLLRLANHYRMKGMTRADTRVKLVEAAHNRTLLHPLTNSIEDAKIDQEILNSVYSGEGYTFTCSDWMLQDKCGGTCQLRCKPLPVVDTTKKVFVGFRDNNQVTAPKASTASLGFKRMKDTVESFEEFAKDCKLHRVESGIKAWDAKMKILPNGLTIINAKSGVGKTSIAMNMMEDISGKGQTGIFYCIDMSETEFYTKAASKALKISPDEALDLFYSEDPKFDELKQEARQRVDANFKNILISYETNLTIDKIEADIKHLSESEDRPSVMFIDYIQKIKGAAEYHHANDILIRLKSLVSKYKVCIVALSQVPGKDGDEETPLLSARAAQGGAIYEQNASICINLWRPMKHAGVHRDTVIGYSISKNRMGECSQGSLYFEGKTSTVRDMTREESIFTDVNMEEYRQEKEARSKQKGKFR